MWPSQGAAIVPLDSIISIRGTTMKPILISASEFVGDAADEERLIRAWRVEQLRRLGLSRAVSETFAPLVDWHEVAALMARGCPPELALEIAL
jgi:hypothetical protein